MGRGEGDEKRNRSGRGGGSDDARGGPGVGDGAGSGAVVIGASDASWASLTGCRPDSTRERPEATRDPAAPLFPPAPRPGLHPAPARPSPQPAAPRARHVPRGSGCPPRDQIPFPLPDKPLQPLRLLLPPVSRPPLDPASHACPRGERGGGGAVGAGGSLPTGDREAETKAVRYHRTAKAAPSPAEPLTRSLGDYPHPK